MNKNIKKEAVRDYDQYGEGGLWKRILKKSYRLKENVREYLDYPSKMEFALFYQKDKLATKIFDWKSQPIENYTEVGPEALSRSTFGLTLKPKLMQVRFKERENPFNECLLGDSEEEEEEDVWDGYHEYPEK